MRTEAPEGQIDIKVDENTCEVSFYWTEDKPDIEGDTVTLFCTDEEGDSTSIVLEQDELLKVLTAGMSFLRAKFPV